ncbi:MAG: sigma-70 family RNA polymerase sigma factor [Lachnospiraceae bacterium]|nr:sigma-70 family RNA polymerase sigma factor [Lachnospiraceae bacterium]
MEDERIIQLFFARSESAIGELHNKYGKTCHKLSANILRNIQDAEECVNDAYLGVWNTVPPTHPNPLLTYVCRIVRNLSIKRYRSNTAMKRNSTYDVAISELEGCLASDRTVEEEVDAKELKGMLNAFLDSLSRENRVIFVRRYWFSETYEQIAKRVGLSEKNVSVRLTRIRKQLREYLEERGVAV